MKHISLRKGLNLPISGAARPEIDETKTITSVGIIGADYIDLKPRITVAEGDLVSVGTPLMADKTMEEAKVVSPIAGRVTGINRGARRKLISITVTADDAAGAPVDFSKVGDIATREGLVERLCAAGLWTSFRTRPYSKVPATDSAPIAIYVTATDSEPLAMDPNIAISAEAEAFAKGMDAVASLTEGTTYLCQSGADALPGADAKGVEAVRFDGRILPVWLARICIS